MRHLRNSFALVSVVAAATALLLVAACTQAGSAGLDADVDSTVAVAVEATVSAELGPNVTPMRAPPPDAGSDSPTAAAVPTATPTPTPTPRPTATPPPTYAPQLTDYVVARGSSRSSDINVFADYAASYRISALLAGKAQTRDDFMAFVWQNTDSNLPFIARQQLKDIVSRYDQGDRSEWVLKLSRPATVAEAEPTCRLALSAMLSSVSPLALGWYRPPSCGELYAEYVASGDSLPRGFIDWVGRSLGVGWLWREPETEPPTAQQGQAGGTAVSAIVRPESVYSMDDVVAAGYKKSKAYPIDTLPHATAAWYGFFSGMDIEVWVYESHADALKHGVPPAEEATKRSGRFFYDAYMVVGNLVLLCEVDLTHCHALVAELP